MKKRQIRNISLDEHMGCYGEFEKTDPVCRYHCALRIRCAIEYEHNFRMEILEDLASAELTSLKMQ